MSLQTWKDEFYKVDADKVPADQALDHSILKWRGLLPENLEKHGCAIKTGGVAKVFDLRPEYPEKPVLINSKSCALCRRYYNNSDDGDHPCALCPLYAHLGQNDCDDDTGLFLRSLENPEWMVTALEGAKRMVDLRNNQSEPSV